MSDRFVQDVGAFHAKFGLDSLEPQQPTIPSREMLQFRLNFMLEELNEIAAANEFILGFTPDGDLVFEEVDKALQENQSDTRRMAQTLDGLVDLLYVLMGTVRFFGFHTQSPAGQRFHEAWRRVQVANMSKVRAPSADASKRNTGFDVVKPEGWVAPKLEDLV